MVLADEQAEQTCYAATTSSAADIAHARTELKEVFHSLAQHQAASTSGAAAAAPGRVVLPVLFGRELVIERATANGLAFLEFDEICGTAVGAPDYVRAP